ncbi:hypothetical protein H5410_003616 [Solanum commersonii]|uniref:Uncharacterized protein n=1 Tax=Solanum commersonii TaxID=4109 RepID=A0A9J6B5L1_SOLCO|nr:hypothetical protein H5410_003616 [Solanum commersonii]
MAKTRGGSTKPSAHVALRKSEPDSETEAMAEIENYQDSSVDATDNVHVNITTVDEDFAAIDEYFTDEADEVTVDVLDKVIGDHSDEIAVDEVVVDVVDEVAVDAVTGDEMAGAVDPVAVDEWQLMKWQLMLLMKW